MNFNQDAASPLYAGQTWGSSDEESNAPDADEVHDALVDLDFRADMRFHQQFDYRAVPDPIQRPPEAVDANLLEPLPLRIGPHQLDRGGAWGIGRLREDHQDQQPGLPVANHGAEPNVQGPDPNQANIAGVDNNGHPRPPVDNEPISEGEAEEEDEDNQVSRPDALPSVSNTLTPHDIVLGRGYWTHANVSEGNRVFREEIVPAWRDHYNPLPRAEKRSFAQAMLRWMRSEGYRFVIRRPEGGFIEAGNDDDDQILDSIMHALRAN
ncbi:unnamed protein product [Cylindrotheca closterium]|uniref:DUF6824 domain-containing protein n=1 Tax=Cylindrotheca closterium TaxID=2856 RepID=A0AAD2G998_9STRA|nr:unnamed protein product [Cylindrotheca closterium]